MFDDRASIIFIYVVENFSTYNFVGFVDIFLGVSVLEEVAEGLGTTGAVFFLLLNGDTSRCSKSLDRFEAVC